MTETNVTRITKLESSQDYREWIRDIKFYANQFGIWPSCDPEETDPPLPPLNPIPHPVYDATNPMAFLYERSAWKSYQDEVDKYHNTLSKVNLAITQSVDRSLHGIYLDKKSPRDILIALKEALKPTTHIERAWLQEQYEQLKKPLSSNTKVTEYFHKWRLVAGKATPYTDYITQYDMTMSLFNALQTLIPNDIAARKANIIDSSDPPNIIEQITYLEQLCMINFPNGKFKGKGNTLKGNFATSQGKDQDGKTTQAKGKVGKSGPDKPCLCGDHHWFYLCKHLNPHLERSPDWKPDRKIQKKVEDKLKQDTKLAEKVKRSIDKWLKKQEKQEKQQDKEPVIASAMIKTGLVSTIAELFNCVILGSGSTIHVANESLSDRIIATRPATLTEAVYTGNGPIQAHAVVDVIIHLKVPNPNGKYQLILKNAYYIPSFMTNIVSLRRLHEINVYHDSSDETCLYHKELNGRRTTWAYIDVTPDGHYILENRNIQGVRGAFITS